MHTMHKGCPPHCRKVRYHSFFPQTASHIANVSPVRYRKAHSEVCLKIELPNVLVYRWENFLESFSLFQALPDLAETVFPPRISQPPIHTSCGDRCSHKASGKRRRCCSSATRGLPHNRLTQGVFPAPPSPA